MQKRPMGAVPLLEHLALVMQRQDVCPCDMWAELLTLTGQMQARPLAMGRLKDIILLLILRVHQPMLHNRLEWRV